MNLGAGRNVLLACGLTLALVASFSGANASAQATDAARLDGFTAARSAAQLQLEDQFQAGMSSARVLDDLNFLAKLPGEAGTPGELRRAKYLERELRKAGLDVAVQNGSGAGFAGYNAAYMKTERTLLTPRGLPERPWYQHQIFAAQFHNGFALQRLPGLYESLSVSNDAAQAQSYASDLATSLTQAAETLRQ